MGLHWTTVKKPKGYLALAVVIVTLIPFAMELSYKGTANLEPVVTNSSNAWSGYRLKFAYPFRNATGTVWAPGDPSPFSFGGLIFSGPVKVSAEFYLAVLIIGALVSCVRLLLYVLLSAPTLEQTLPPYELFITGLMTLMSFISSVVFIYHVKNNMAKEVGSELNAKMDVCRSSWPSGCEVKNSTGVYGQLYAASAFGFILAAMWGVSVWLSYRNTYLQRPYYVQQVDAGTGPGTKHVATGPDPSKKGGRGVALQSMRIVGGSSTPNPAYGADLSGNWA